MHRRASCTCPLTQPKVETCCTDRIAHTRLQGAVRHPTFLHAGPRFVVEAVGPTQRPIQTSPTGSAPTAVSILIMRNRIVSSVVPCEASLGRKTPTQLSHSLVRGAAVGRPCRCCSAEQVVPLNYTVAETIRHVRQANSLPSRSTGWREEVWSSFVWNRPDTRPTQNRGRKTPVVCGPLCPSPTTG